jgi:phosphoribosylformylglycinamidine synthase
MAMAKGIGAELDFMDVPGAHREISGDMPSHAFLFGEDQGRYVVTCSYDEINQLQKDAIAAGVPTWHLGETGGDALVLPGEEPLAIADLRKIHEDWLPSYMAGKAA